MTCDILILQMLPGSIVLFEMSGLLCRQGINSRVRLPV
jgi:hypothetical protein